MNNGLGSHLFKISKSGFSFSALKGHVNLLMAHDQSVDEIVISMSRLLDFSLCIFGWALDSLATTARTSERPQHQHKACSDAHHPPIHSSCDGFGVAAAATASQGHRRWPRPAMSTGSFLLQ